MEYERIIVKTAYFKFVSDIWKTKPHFYDRPKENDPFFGAI